MENEGDQNVIAIEMVIFGMIQAFAYHISGVMYV